MDGVDYGGVMTILLTIAGLWALLVLVFAALAAWDVGRELNRAAKNGEP